MIKNLMQKIPNYEKTIATYIQDRAETFFSSDKFKTLKKRYDSINNSLDLRFGQNDRAPRNSFKVNFVIPLARETMTAQRAIAWNAFQKDPMYTLTPSGSTSWDSAKKMQMTLNTHLENRKYKAKAFMKHIDQCARYGMSINYAYFNTSAGTVLQTVPNYINGIRVGYTQQEVENYDRGVSNDVIHVLNIYFNPNVADIDKTDFIGFKDRMALSSFAAQCRDNPLYIQKNVKKVIKDVKASGDNVDNDLGRVATTVNKGYYKLHFKNNEDDDTLYYCETVDDTLIRIHPNFNERNNTNIDIMTFEKRIDSPMGNASNEMQIPMEHMLHTLMNMEADTAVQRLQNYILYNANLGVDPTKINDAAKNGGWIPVWAKPGDRFSDLFHQVSFQNDGYRGIEWITNEVKESGQRVKEKPDYMRTVNTGGVRNDTATAANIMKTEGDLIANFYLSQFAHGMANVGESNMDILKQYLAPYFVVRTKQNADPIELTKEEILGNHGVKTETSLTINNQLQAMNLYNVLTGLQNFRGTMDPTWQNVNMTDLARGWIKAVVPNFDVDRIFPENIQQPMVQQNPAMQPQVSMEAAIA